MDCKSAAAERPRCVEKRVGRGRPKSPEEAEGPPVGGYISVSVLQIAMVWFAFRERLIRWRDVRAYFAWLEAAASRDAHERATKARVYRRYELCEVDRLVGGRGGQRVNRESVNRLQHAGLMTWSESRIEFTVSPDRIPVPDLGGLWAMLDVVASPGSWLRSRRVPIPRRTVREIAGNLKRSVVACILAHLIRCVFKHRDGFRYEGSCKATFVASLFGIDERQARRARKHLESIGWLGIEDSEHWHRQRFGGRAVVNNSWGRPAAEPNAVTCLPCRTPEKCTRLPGPVSDVETPTDYKNQKPAGGGRSGFLKEEGPEEKNRPTWRDIKRADLRDTGRTLELFDDAVGRGVLDRSEHSRLMFVAAAERAAIRGTSNPPGLFRRLVEQKLWHHITQGDEDAAHERLKRYFGHARAPEERPVQKAWSPPKGPALSDDARLVQAVQVVARQHRIDDAFHLLRRERPDWTRERWGRAVEEIENARLARLRAAYGGKEGGEDARRGRTPRRGGVRAFDTTSGMSAVPTPG